MDWENQEMYDFTKAKDDLSVRVILKQSVYWQNLLVILAISSVSLSIRYII